MTKTEIIDLFAEAANAATWQVLKEHYTQFKHCRDEAADCFKNGEKANGRTFNEHAETYRQSLITLLDKRTKVERFIVKHHPSLLGEVPYLTWDTIGELDPVDMAVRFRALLGKVLDAHAKPAVVTLDGFCQSNPFAPEKKTIQNWMSDAGDVAPKPLSMRPTVYDYHELRAFVVKRRPDLDDLIPERPIVS